MRNISRVIENLEVRAKHIRHGVGVGFDLGRGSQRFREMLSCRAQRSIVEFGTSFGISTLHLAAALRDNGGGRLITSEFEPAKVARARTNLTAGG